ncbi:MAG: carboxypeptidase regulatory-like domain-containing protein [Crocinitomicaceae bacterium]|nr:carboxypeptidase regulatory-like domain-containing protein [Crocinitomicaceae bacterium]
MSRIQLYSITALVVFSFWSCNKTEGPGGTSTIRGTVTGKEYNQAVHERTEIICSPGSQVEHGDFFILNAPDGNELFYVWYNNPTWISDGDPALAGRTGIEVSFNYSDSNTDIAVNTADAINAVGGLSFDVVVQNDILILTNKASGNVADANNMSSPFEINIAEQGEDEFYSEEMPLADARVYIVYGDNTGYGDDVITGGDGDYAFSNLVKGDYTIYVVSKDSLNPESTVKSSVNVTITDNKSVTEAAVINCLY